MLIRTHCGQLGRVLFGMLLIVAFSLGLAGVLTAINALGTGLTGQGVRIGVVDSGVNRTHPALAGRVVANYTYVDSEIQYLSSSGEPSARGRCALIAPAAANCFISSTG